MRVGLAVGVKAKKMTLVERIDRILATFGGPMSADALAHRLFPNPRSWKCKTGGGPPGCFMTLGAALRRGNFDVSIKGAGPSNRIVWGRKTR